MGEEGECGIIEALFISGQRIKPRKLFDFLLYHETKHGSSQHQLHVGACSLTCFKIIVDVK